ncbi:MerR family transcriptional regulator [Streptomyces sodiiphilus]|uniref:MerR family transcriptional regulator n=1 Tax=Streptomyces sodiiphilus TaxID=226217 RepID=A0ABP5AP87_9ACTN
MVMGRILMRIGEVAECTGLSPRTIRHYEEAGLTGPGGDAGDGGTRLYTETEVRRPALARRMRSLGFRTADVRSLAGLLDRLPEAGDDRRAYEELVARLREFWQETDARCEEMRRELQEAEDFARTLHRHLARLTGAPAAPRSGGAR